MTTNYAATVRSEHGTTATSTIRIEKEYHKFSAAHFLIFDDGSAERLHGHNYRVAVELDTPRRQHGMVIDFKRVKPLISAILAPLDEHLVIPGRHPVLTCEDIGAGETEIRFGRRRYIVPSDEVCVLPISNSSSEDLAEYIARSLLEALQRQFATVELARLAVSVEETPGQRGIFTLGF